MAKKFPFKVGADPEFNITLQHKMINAQQLISHLLEEKNDREENGQGYKIPEGGVGWDGYDATGELRPEPAYSAGELTANMGALLKTIAIDVNMMELKTSSENAPVGYHIHLELKEELANKIRQNREQSVKEIGNISKKLASFSMPIILGETLLNNKIRMGKGYGNILDFKTHRPNESNVTLELRHPSAEWLTTPKLTKSIIAYYGTVYNEIINNPINFNKLCSDFTIKRKDQTTTYQKLASKDFSKINNQILGRIRRSIRKFEFYKTYKEEIEFILSPNKVLREKRKYKFDIIKGWKFEPLKKQTLTNLLEKNNKKKKTTMKIAQLCEVISFSYNENDFKMGAIIDKLKEVVIKNKWKMNNTYYFYGAKSTTKKYIVFKKDENFKNLIATKEPLTRRKYNDIMETCTRMYKKLIENNQASNFITKEKQYLIGIPLQVRKKGDIDSLVRIIHKIENYKIKPKEINENTLNDNISQDQENDFKKNNKENDLKQILQKDCTRPENRQETIRNRREITEEERRTQEEQQLDTENQEITDRNENGSFNTYITSPNLSNITT